jgi:hypothetical protein
VDRATTGRTNQQWLSGQNLDGFPIPNGERSNWDFLPGRTPYCCRANLDPSTELVLEGGSDDKPSHVESFHLTLNQPMAPLHTFVWDDPLSLLRPTEGIPVKTINLLSNPKFDGEGHVSAFTHLNHLTSLDEILRLFKTMKYVDFSSSHSKGELNPGLGHCQQNQFIAGNNSWKCLSLLMKIMFMMNSLMNWQKFHRLRK